MRIILLEVIAERIETFSVCTSLCSKIITKKQMSSDRLKSRLGLCDSLPLVLLRTVSIVCTNTTSALITNYANLLAISFGISKRLLR